MRSEPRRGFIEHEQFGPPHDRPPDGQHLLFSPAQRARPLSSSLFQDWEEIIDPLEVFLDLFLLATANESPRQ